MKQVNCLKCKHFAGMISKHYFRCGKDIIDTDFLTRGWCINYDDLYDNDALECNIEKDDQSLPNKE